MKMDSMPSVDEQIARLKESEDKEIDFSDITEIKNWSNAIRGKFYRPIKKHVTIRLDADILEWFKRKYPQYHTAINNVLRQYIDNTIHKSE